MSWRKVSDDLHSHPKWGGLSLSARGLWVTCLSWTGQHMTDGAVPEFVVKQHAGAQARKLAAELVAAGMWDAAPVEGQGWVFHDYHAYQPTSYEERQKRTVTSEVRSLAGKKGMANRWANDNKPANKTITPNPNQYPDKETPTGVGVAPLPPKGESLSLQVFLDAFRAKRGRDAVLSDRRRCVDIAAELSTTVGDEKYRAAVAYFFSDADQYFRSQGYNFALFAKQFEIIIAAVEGLHSDRSTNTSTAYRRPTAGMGPTAPRNGTGGSPPTGGSGRQSAYDSVAEAVEKQRIAKQQSDAAAGAFGIIPVGEPPLSVLGTPAPPPTTH